MAPCLPTLQPPGDRVSTKAKKGSRKTDGRKQRRVPHRAAAPRPRVKPHVAVEKAPAEALAAAQVPVVAIGASAGGLDAFSQVLEGLTEDPGVALVFIQHLAPQHESALPTLLSGRTRLPVVQVSEGTHVEPNHVYVIPPNAQMEIREGELHLNPRPEDRTQYTPIDFFFRSLAETAGAAAIGVVLSGSSSDGAAGLREIKAVGGITIAQLPETARYDGMPRAAIATEMVDLVLSPPDIAREILRIGRHPYVKLVRPRHDGDEVTIEEDELSQIIALLRGASGIDFAHYKTPTIKRRLQRRMMLHKISDIREYVEFLRATPDEGQKLSQDILIHVTRFFREPESFVALRTDVFPEIAKRDGEGPIRIWVPGCSTGEEVYSVAIALLEFLGDQSGTTPIQIFGTDVSESAIESARLGLYPQTIGGDVSIERLRRFFSKSDGGVRIHKFVRDLCVFARQDLTRDPPFSKLDLIVCRNVLIYLGAALQGKLLGVFQYALKPSGFLMLGQAETTGAQAELFTLVDKTNRIFRKKGNGVLRPVTVPANRAATRSVSATSHALEVRPPASTHSAAQRVMLERYAPPGVIVDDGLQIIQFIGHTGRFLESPPGEAKLNLPKMVRDGLLHGLRTAFQQARREDRLARRGELHIRHDGHDLEVAIEVAPLSAGAGKDRNYLVTFQETPSPGAERRAARKKSGGHTSERRGPRVVKLEQELAASRDYLQSIIQELESANQELQSANEEILSSNEELQSTNEELDTAKEELQSTNAELNPVNEELHGRNDELSQVNSDLLNLLASVQVPLVIVESDLRIRRFTPMAERVLNLIPSDVGRPIGHIKPNIDCPDLEERVRKVVEHVDAQVFEVCDRQGRWYSLHIRPYKNVDNRIDGAVLALFDIDAAKRHEAQIESARQYADAIIQTIRESLVVLDRDLRVKTVNKAFQDTFGVSAHDTEGRRLYEIGDGQWDIPALRARLAEVLEQDGQIEAFEVEHDFPAIGHRRMLLNARRIERRDGSPELLLLAIEDVTKQPERGGT
jgi:two-component system CheB/CheR fusion protein